MSPTKTTFALVALAGLSLASLSLLFTPQPVAAQDKPLDGRAIMEKFDKHNRSKTDVVDSVMTIVGADHQRRVRKMTFWIKASDGDDDWTLIKFTGSGPLRGTGLLVLEKGASDSTWLYLPEHRKSKRISGAGKADSFVGSDFSNYDMRTEDLANHKYTLLGEATVGDRACYKVEAKPANEYGLDETGYSRRVFYVDKEWWVGHKVEYWDRAKKPLKVLLTSGYKQHKGLWRPKTLTVTNIQEGSKTQLLQADDRKINEPLEDTVFTKRELERG